MNIVEYLCVRWELWCNCIAWYCEATHCENVCVILSGFYVYVACLCFAVLCVGHTSFWVVGVLSPSNRRANRRKTNKRTQNMQQVGKRARNDYHYYGDQNTITIIKSLEFLRYWYVSQDFERSWLTTKYTIGIVFVCMNLCLKVTNRVRAIQLKETWYTQQLMWFTQIKKAESEKKWKKKSKVFWTTVNIVD